MVNLSADGWDSLYSVRLFGLIAISKEEDKESFSDIAGRNKLGKEPYQLNNK